VLSAILTTVRPISATVLSICVASQATAQPGVRAQATIERTSGVIRIAGTPHPYIAEGKGLPCIVVGLAPGYASLFSERLKQRIRFILVDFKNTWGAEAPRDVEKITLDVLVGEIDEVRRALGLDQVCVVGHSMPGLLALEYAVRHPGHLSHGILIGMPPSYTAETPKRQAAFWEADASAERKAVKRRLDEGLPEATLMSLSTRDAFAMRYVRNGPKYFFDASYDFSWAWVGRDFSPELFTRYFNVIVAGYDPQARLSTNTVPLFLGLGRYDYAVPFSMWNGVKDRIPRLTAHLFEQSSHFPMLEEPALFDERLIAWLETSR
jgi:proline iminopeptidase